MTDNYSDEIDAGLKAQPTAAEPKNPYQLSIDELPKHSNELAGYAIANPPYAPEPDDKHWYESKTIWFNAIVIAVGLATQASPALEGLMSAEVYAVIATFVAFINAVLRLATGQPIKSGGV